MKKVTLYILFLLFAVGLQNAGAQVPHSDSDRIFGFDPLLYNGRVYSFFVQPGTEGTQFIDAEFDTKGNTTIRGTTYKDLVLNYDIYNQQLILKYTNALGSTSLIELSKAWLEMFEINGRHFEIITESDTSKRICQVIGNGRYSVRYYFYKELLPDTRSSSRKYVFSVSEKEMFIYSGVKMERYKNNRSFVSLFNAEQQEKIKKILRQQKIKVKKANDYKISELITYCNTLPSL